MKNESNEDLTAQRRSFHTPAPPGVLSSVQSGVLHSVYRGVPFLKSPFDIGIYLQLLAKLQPRTVLEVGTKHGGSALWFADMLSAAGVDLPSVISVDIKPIAAFSDPRITFLQGEACDLGRVLTPDLMNELTHPWLVVEDSSHFYEDSSAVLRFFHQYLQSGDYIVVEDGIVGQFPEKIYERYANGPNRAVADFLSEFGDHYRVDERLCDFYGYNLTYNPNGYLQRVRDA